MSRLPLRLGVNIDHVATVRQARGAPYPDPVEAGLLAARSGADSITVHLREDRRHIQPHDVEVLVKTCPVPINLELAVTDAMLDFACRVRPRFACLVPEKREERTTEGGLDIVSHTDRIRSACARLADSGIAVALFIEPDRRLIETCLAIAAPHVEIHTGRYADVANFEASAIEYVEIADFAAAAHAAGLEVHAGHGLNLHNTAPVAAIPEIVELNIGHAIVARSLFVGLAEAIAEIRREMDRGRTELAV